MALLLLAARQGHGDAFAEFRIPDHRVLDWTGAFDARGQWSSSSTTRSLQPYDRSASRTMDGQFASRLAWTRDADPARATLRAAAVVSGRRWSYESADTYAYSIYRGSDDWRSLNRRMTERAELTFSHDRFLSAIPILWRLGASGLIDHAQVWDSHADRTVRAETTDVRHDFDEFAVRRKDYLSGVSGTLGLGTGRVRNATGVYEAMVFERRLARAGVIEQPLSDVARRRLAALMYARAAYAGTQDRPARGLWSGIADILREDGALAGLDSPGLTARLMEPFFGSTVRIAPDGLPESPITRRTGMELTLEVRTVHDRSSLHYHRNEYRSALEDTLPPQRTVSSSVRKSTRSDLRVGAVAAFHRPVGERWQLDITGTLDAPARRGVSADYRVDAAATWIVADRWLGALSVFHRWFDEKRTAGPTRGDQAEWRATIDVAYYLERSTLVSLGLVHADTWLRGSADYHAYWRSTMVRLGLTYRFAGRFTAPLLALAPTPPTIGLEP